MSIVLLWCTIFAIYLLFAGQISRHEVLTGIVLASLATAWARIVAAASQRHFRFALAFSRPLGRGLGHLISAALVTSGVLARVAVLGDRAGHAEVHRFIGSGTFRPPADRARRAIAVLLASCAPDRFVVNIDHHSGTVLIHAIVPGERELDPQWLT